MFRSKSAPSKFASTLIALAASTLSTINTNAFAQAGAPGASNQGTQEPDWVLQAETGISPKAFGQMDQIVKVGVNYFRANDENHKTAFEELWYHNGKAFGIDRSHQLEMTAGQNVAVRVLESPTAFDPEHKAAANTVMRLILNIMLQHDKVAYVKVPDSSYWFISQELINRNARAVPSMDLVPAQAKIVFQLQAEKMGQKQIMYFL